MDSGVRSLGNAVRLRLDSSPKHLQESDSLDYDAGLDIPTPKYMLDGIIEVAFPTNLAARLAQVSVDKAAFNTFSTVCSAWANTHCADVIQLAEATKALQGKMDAALKLAFFT